MNILCFKFSWEQQFKDTINITKLWLTTSKEKSWVVFALTNHLNLVILSV